MRDRARALDDVSDHLGEVLRRADDLLAEWSKFGAQVRGQVEREAAAIGEVVEGAVGRVAAAGVDRAIGDRLRALTGELERLEQRARAAARTAVAERDRDRRLLWAAVAGIVLANALLVVLVVRRPEAPPAPEPIRIDAPAAAEARPETAGQAPAPAVPDVAATPPGDGSAAGSAAVGASGADSLRPGPELAAGAGGKPAAAAATHTGAASGSGARAVEAGRAGTGRAGEPGGAAGRAGDAAAPRASPIALPPKPSGGRAHKKLP